jgi:hypothetical protein
LNTPLAITTQRSSTLTSVLMKIRLRVERMIAQGKAHPDDRFFYVSWRR